MVKLTNVNGMNEVIKTFKITFGFLMLVSLFSVGWNFYQQKKAESNCQEFKQFRSNLEKSEVSTSLLELEESKYCK
jgi:hypothetical protein